MPANGQRSRINVPSNEKDAELLYIREKFEPNELPAGSLDELKKKLSTLIGPVPVVDLICHSTASDHYLRLNRWVVRWDDQTVSDYFNGEGKARFRELDVKWLRLIGCGTATTKRGWETIRQIASALGIEVFGTTELVYAGDFDGSGYVGVQLVGSGDRAFRPSPARAPAGTVSAKPRLALPRAARVDNAAFDLSGLQPMPANAFRAGARAKAHGLRVEVPDHWRDELPRLVRCSPAWELPGLLTTPLMELFVPSRSDGSSMSKVEILFQHELVRVHVRGRRHPLVYRVKNPARLASAVASAPPL
jgi:hypothetical protein